MKKQIVLHLILTILTSGTLVAQDTTSFYVNNHQPQNAWFVELGGSSFIGVTFNYECFLSKRPGGLSLRVGFGGGLPALYEVAGFVAIPVGVSYNIPISKKKNHFVEIGSTYTTFLAGVGETSLLSGVLGWRYDAKFKGLHLRATLMPINYVPSEDFAFGSWFGFSIGKRF